MPTAKTSKQENCTHLREDGSTRAVFISEGNYMLCQGCQWPIKQETEPEAFSYHHMNNWQWTTAQTTFTNWSVPSQYNTYFIGSAGVTSPIPSDTGMSWSSAGQISIANGTAGDASGSFLSIQPQEPEPITHRVNEMIYDIFQENRYE